MATDDDRNRPLWELNEELNRESTSDERAAALRSELRQRYDASNPRLRHLMTTRGLPRSDWRNWPSERLEDAVRKVRRKYPDLPARQARSAVKWTIAKEVYGVGVVTDHHVQLVVRNLVVPPRRGDPGYDAWYRRRRRLDAAYRGRENAQRRRRRGRQSGPRS